MSDSTKGKPEVHPFDQKSDRIIATPVDVAHKPIGQEFVRASNPHNGGLVEGLNTAVEMAGRLPKQVLKDATGYVDMKMLDQAGKVVAEAECNISRNSVLSDITGSTHENSTGANCKFKAPKPE